MEYKLSIRLNSFIATSSTLNLTFLLKIGLCILREIQFAYGYEHFKTKSRLNDFQHVFKRESEGKILFLQVFIKAIKNKFAYMPIPNGK